MWFGNGLKVFICLAPAGLNAYVTASRYVVFELFHACSPRLHPLPLFITLPLLVFTRTLPSSSPEPLFGIQFIKYPTQFYFQFEYQVQLSTIRTKFQFVPISSSILVHGRSLFLLKILFNSLSVVDGRLRSVSDVGTSNAESARCSGD